MLKEKLLKARKEKKFTQEDLATYLNISKSEFQRKETGVSKIHNDEWERIAKLLNVPVEDIFEEDPCVSIYNSYDNKFDNNSGNYFIAGAANNFYAIPDYVLKNQQKYIESLERKIEGLDIKIKELEKTGK
jgi:transcriptional regulator with XRE-family HTH domain